MNKFCQAAGILFISSILINQLPALAHQINKVNLSNPCASEKIDNNNHCVQSRENLKLAELPTVKVDWRQRQRIPYSTPVMVKDDFEGEYIAVIDRNYSGDFDNAGVQTSIITNWSKKYVRVSVYSEKQGKCTFLCFSPPIERTADKVNSLEVKVGDQVFKLTGTNNQFAVTPELAKALLNAPDENAAIRMTGEGGGEPVVSSIGRGTVKAWKSVYQ